jgi:ArsR family transcriptional regulator, arsenate/arsenite/antimonite-responsive transcriptional repressor
MAIYPPCDFTVTLRYEPFFALWSLLAPEAKAHRPWAAAGQDRLGREARAALAALHGAPGLWPALGDLVGTLPPGLEISDLQAALARPSPQEFAEDLLTILIGERPAAKALFETGILPDSLKEALGPAAAKRLAKFGLVGGGAGNPMNRLVGDLVADPAGVQQAVSSAFGHFWADLFAATWERLRPALASSLERMRASFDAGEDGRRPWQSGPGRPGFAVELDPARRALRDPEGELNLPFNRIARIHLFPSAFNETLFWSVPEGPTARRHVYFPCFDAAIEVPAARGNAFNDPSPSGEAAAIFRALGDATRFAIATLIARQNMSATEIADRLGLSKPTLSHHLKELRRANLIDASGDGRTRRLSLSRAAIETISDKAVRALFETQAPEKFGRSRRRRDGLGL